MTDPQAQQDGFILTSDSEIIVLDYPGPAVGGRVKNLHMEGGKDRVTYALDETRPRVLGVREYARKLLGDKPRSKRVSLIVAYCAAGAIARELAVLCEESSGWLPPICLINPESADPEDAVAAARGALAQAGIDQLEATEILLPGGAKELTPTAMENFEEKLIECYLAEVGSDGPASDIAYELASQQVDWVAHIAAAGSGGLAQDCSGELHVTSMDHLCPRSCTAEHVIEGADSAELFCSDLRATIQGLMGQRDPKGELTEKYLRMCVREDASTHYVRGELESSTPESPYQGRLLGRPLFRDSLELVSLGRDLSHLMNILTSVPERCFGGNIEAFLAAQGQSSTRSEIIRRGSTGTVARYGRADAISTKDGFRVIEFNMGSDIGGVDTPSINDAFLQNPSFRDFAVKHQIGHINMASLLAAQLRNIAMSVVGTSDPVVGLIEETDSGGSASQVAAALAECGVQVVMGELDGLSSTNGKIVLNGDVPLDVVLRYFFVDHLLHEPDGLKKIDMLMAAQSAGKTAWFTSLDSDAYGNKAALALLQHAVVRSTLSDMERELVDRLVPWTRLIGSDFSIVSRREHRQLLEECVGRREELVVKPAFGNNSIGVHMGSRMTDEQWSSLLRSPAVKNCVVQERMVPEPERIIDSLTGEVEVWEANWGVFVGESGYSGSFVRALRASDEGVIGGSEHTQYGCVFTGTGGGVE
ncbi:MULTISPECIES: hypothetical protein [unclassified Streptomyces]|uniref:hypothetical protein n=1 Tax=unclassified Streptomyces TaxID=2593676 RepID=UPI0029AD9EFB|nr:MULTISPECIES: hypothetical protein [unclassified Streptomyces]MDX3767883.1 hypothetical protein [Streptomyces sp. AK08-01B]MDX3818110.1 hypothetical protein [Streptomyces sp. AK08-01A]